MATFKPKKYVSWRPNKAFVKFFEDMSERKISVTDSPTVRVTDTSPPSKSKVAQSLTQKEKEEEERSRQLTKQKSTKQKPSASSKSKTKATTSKSGTRKKLTSLEKRIRDHTFL